MVRDLGSFPRPVLAALAAAERLLTRRAGATVVLADPEDLGGSDRSVVARARVARNPFSLPRTLVVKHYLAEPDPDQPDPFHYEVASCQLFTALPADARPSPVLIAHDPQARLLVLEDLGRSSTLADKLFGPDPADAQRCLLSWARALGRMQAATAGRENDFGALLRRLGARAWRDPMAEEARVALAKAPELLADELGVRVPAAATLEAHETARLLGGTRYRAFSPSDTCPDNNLVTSRGVRFVDFEWGCFRDVALDAAYFRVPFPGCEASFALPPGIGRHDARLVARRDRPPSGPTSTTAPSSTAGSCTPSCCGCGCARGGCCRGSASATARSGSTPPAHPGSARRSGTTGGRWRVRPNAAACPPPRSSATQWPTRSRSASRTPPAHSPSTRRSARWPDPLPGPKRRWSAHRSFLHPPTTGHPAHTAGESSSVTVAP